MNVSIAHTLFLLDAISGFLLCNGNSAIGFSRSRRGSLQQDPLTTGVISNLSVSLGFVLQFSVNS